ncbi:hypothetical protein NLX62_00305 [Mycobacteriaceae bacterium Msp059]|nr:hypothetical protein [Mycobacteriaceae bacterium Msp059]
MKRRHNARRTDPGTSHNAGRANRGSRQSHQRKMLEAYMSARLRGGLTDHEAAVRAGLNQPGICWWHRASDLRAAGLIEWVTRPDGSRVTVRGDNGVSVGMSQITETGIESIRWAAA